MRQCQPFYLCSAGKRGSESSNITNKLPHQNSLQSATEVQDKNRKQYTAESIVRHVAIKTGPHYNVLWHSYSKNDKVIKPLVYLRNNCECFLVNKAATDHPSRTEDGRRYPP